MSQKWGYTVRTNMWVRRGSWAWRFQHSPWISRACGCEDLRPVRIMTGGFCSIRLHLFCFPHTWSLSQQSPLYTTYSMSLFITMFLLLGNLWERSLRERRMKKAATLLWLAKGVTFDHPNFESTIHFPTVTLFKVSIYFKCSLIWG